MVKNLVGEALLSACIQVLFERLASREVVDFIRGKKLIDGLLKKLKITLLSVNAVLNDAEERQLRYPAVKAWLDELKEAIYDAEDLICEINAEALQRKLEDELGISGNQVKKLIYTSFATFDKAMEPKIERILERLEFVVKQKDVLHLGEGSQNRTLRRAWATPLVEESGVFGRNADKETIVELLLSDDSGDNKVSVIPVVGMGGIGKTTLAQLVYHDERVRRHFDNKVWVTVSDEDEFDAFRITKAIFEAITYRRCDIEDLYQLQVQLKAFLGRQKFLFVLDDVWNEDYIRWDVLTSPFKYGAKGSKIIVTTRNENVASIMGNVSTFRVRTISEDDSWLLFAKHAFNDGDLHAHSSLLVIGRQIVQKCKGLPLAIKSLAGLLHSKPNAEDWQKILKNDIWELFIKEHNVLPSLWLSYHHLPSSLKRCFAYCSIFPKGYELKKEQLILLWMAEDLLQDEKGKTIEDVGEEYFNALISRSLFQQSIRDSKLVVTMHDLVHDLASFISGEFCLRLDDGNLDGLVSKTRHLSFMNENMLAYEGSMKFEQVVISKDNCLRTFLPLKQTKKDLFPNKWILPTIPTIRCLRVLSLIGYHIEELPHSIGNLKHLRYLDLSHAKVSEIPYTVGSLQSLQALLLSSCLSLTQLPDSIGSLKQLRYLDLSFSSVKRIPNTICTMSNLQSLLLSGCACLTLLPTTLGRLTNMRHLDISETPLFEMPPYMGYMRSLQTLTDFVLGEHTRSSIKELKELQNLQGGLKISGLEEHVSVRDVLEANLKDKKYLSELKLVWRGYSNNPQTEKEILDMLEPHPNLKELLIQYYCGAYFSNWIGRHSFSSIVKVSLIECARCSSLPPLGQLPSLVELKISGFARIKNIGAEFYCNNGSSNTSPFRSLEILHFEDMPCWQQWTFVQVNEGARIFPHLKELRLIICPNLIVHRPNGLPFPTRLQAPEVQQSVSPLSRNQQIDAIFSSLQRVKIEKCPELEFFPGGRLPANLVKLDISGCNKFLAHRMHWGMQRLSSLRSLRIEDCGNTALYSFPEEGLLPLSLTSITIFDLPNLRFLNRNGIQHLSFLRKLKIYDCPVLESLPNEGFPASLQKLRICKCPLLEPRCETETGEDWHKIAHIPVLEFEDL